MRMGVSSPLRVDLLLSACLEIDEGVRRRVVCLCTCLRADLVGVLIGELEGG